LAHPPSAVKDVMNGCEAVAKKLQSAMGGEFLQITQKDGLGLGPVKYAEVK
jgi:hypothetical protein